MIYDLPTSAALRCGRQFTIYANSPEFWTAVGSEAPHHSQSAADAQEVVSPLRSATAVQKGRFASTTFSALRFSAFIAILAFVLFPSLTQAETFLLTGATVHTVSGETITNGQVLLHDGKISAVGKSVPATDAKTISLEGLQLYPGMIALNTDLGLVEIDAVRSTVDVREAGDYTPDVYSWLAVNPDSQLLPVARANGISHFEPVPAGSVIAGQSGLLAMDGWTTEQMVTKKSIALHVYWPGAGLDTMPKEKSRNPAKWKSLEDQDKERREKLRELDDFFAEARAYAKARNGGRGFNVVPAWEAMLPVLSGEIPLTIHADDVRQIRAAVSWAATNGVKMILAGGLDSWRIADMLATNHVPVIFSHVFTLPQRETDGYAVNFSAPGVLSKAGVKIAFGGGGASLVKNMPYAAAQTVAFGLPPDEALKSLTLYPAQIAGVSERLGSIEPGKDATLFAADGDILDIRSNVKLMWIAGKEVSLENRHTRLYEKYRNRPKTQ